MSYKNIMEWVLVALFVAVVVFDTIATECHRRESKAYTESQKEVANNDQ